MMDEPTKIDWTNPGEVRAYFRKHSKEYYESSKGRQHIRDYQQKPKVKKRRKEYMKQYLQKPEVIVKQRNDRRKHVLGIKNKTIYGLNKRDWTGYCELCGRKNIRLGYHHWDNKNPSKGLWLCIICHQGCEHYEKHGLQIIKRYKKFKKILDNEELK